MNTTGWRKRSVTVQWWHHVALSFRYASQADVFSCAVLLVRGRTRRRKTASQKKPSDPLTSLRAMRRRRSPWRTSRRWPPLGPVRPTRWRMKARLLPAPSQSLRSSRQPNHPALVGRFDVCLFKRGTLFCFTEHRLVCVRHGLGWAVPLCCGRLARTVMDEWLLWLLNVHLW